ncbi:MAG TPA: damage-control phosphatase ARMT1 family protein [Roseiflexaceae bacterium]|nr:damage-control phosphatase ARMT1 family protein [Roseiflexaceae bacterium]HMP39113.1 damage-control phosphatase ARMT1 family protein [Roseiflexaceae bacterium]
MDLALPDVLHGGEVGSFAENTIRTRLPAIARRIFRENQLSASVAAQLEALIADIPHTSLSPIADNAPDVDSWNAALAPYTGASWLEAPWFVVETYFYRRVIAATRYFHGGIDPFSLQKRLGLNTSSAPIAALAGRLAAWLAGNSPPTALAPLLTIALWGNQADLSLWPADAAAHAAAETLHTDETQIIVNDTAAVAAYLARPTPRIDLVADNAGYELVCDLALVDLLLHGGLAHQVVVHVKLHPTFVSDATEADVHATIAHLGTAADAPTRAFGTRLQAALDAHRLQLQCHPFWTSPLVGWEMPADLYSTLSHTRLLISKGDANYRRWLGDRRWPFSLPFSRVVHYTPAPLLALRTCKSNLIVGLDPLKPAELAACDPGWLTNGRWGVIQFSAATPP